jgi:ribosomal protein S18 acetylase RimI-like enzyme
VGNPDQTSPPLILSAGPEHLAEISALAAVVWRAHYPGIISPAQIEYMLERMYDLEVIRQELAHGVSYDRLLVGDELVGFASYGRTAAPQELKLHKLYVHPARQRQGLGSLLLKHVESAACENRFCVLMLSVNKANRQAIAAYQKNGYIIRATVTVDIGGGFVMDDYIMEKYL